MNIEREKQCRVNVTGDTSDRSDTWSFKWIFKCDTH